MERRMAYLEKCFPLYNTRAGHDPDALKRAILNHDVGLAFNGPNNEQGRMDFRADAGAREMPGAGARRRHGPDRRRSH